MIRFRDITILLYLFLRFTNGSSTCDTIENCSCDIEVDPVAGNYAHCRNLGIIIVPKGNQEITAMDLSFNKITQLDVNSFVTVPFLKSLIITHNRLTAIGLNVFNLTPHLSFLLLDHNITANIGEETFIGTPKMYDLFMFGNKYISGVPNKVFDKFENLRQWFLSDSRIPGSPSLENSELYSCNIAKLPVGIFDKLGNLQLLKTNENTHKINWTAGVIDKLENVSLIELDWFIDKNCILYPWVVHAVTDNTSVKMYTQNQITKMEFMLEVVLNGSQFRQEQYKKGLFEQIADWLDAMMFCEDTTINMDTTPDDVNGSKDILIVSIATIAGVALLGTGTVIVIRKNQQHNKIDPENRGHDGKKMWNELECPKEVCQNIPPQSFLETKV